MISAMVPGPTTALVIRRSALSGTRATLPVVAGMELGLYSWVVASGLGLSALVAVSDAAFVVIRVVGAVVLIALGVQAWRQLREPMHEVVVDEGAVRATRRRAASIGLLTNLTNPKLPVFTFAFYPQFVGSGPDALPNTLLLGVLHILIDAMWFTLVAAFVGRARTFFARTRVRQWLEGITGAVLIGIGVRMAVSEV
ncbi:LysE family translocator [Nocardia panacis]|uniref:LysE family translocator n=1 Tax=Nocardia panacis TaxID=2340916 RepID=A0A3A4KF61_9NOCA|nr:LysE family translocator [Nocardia panacis]